MIVLDTSVLAGIFLVSDAHYFVSRAWYGWHASQKAVIHIPAFCVIELAGVLGRQGIAQTEILSSIRALSELETIFLHSQDVESALFAAEVAAEAGLRGADATFVALAAKLDLPLVSWDRQQRERGAAFCRTMTPAEAMEMTE